ncbi:DNA-binding response regulator [Labrys sp. WJW]|uniref:response regulator transcription factor n=1 Tax=Labrys sp. WJW TaxID=1737983 RepID=UPI00082E3731|nr:response regulator transcription factor [Labrys sp. WJW]OCC05546.1 DNA-binding response regulator [Labrys sp. WJW]
MRILMVDDHPIVVSGCRAMLAAELDCTIIAADSMQEGEVLATSDALDLCIIDLNLPDGSGFELCKRILANNPDMPIVIFSMNDDLVFAARAIELGVAGYVSKAGDPSELIAAIREVLRNGVYLPHRIARSLAFSRRNSSDGAWNLLSRREIDILRYLGQGKSLSEIAPLVGVSYKTVANACVIMKRKLGARTSSDLVRLAVENRLAVL